MEQLITCATRRVAGAEKPDHVSPRPPPRASGAVRVLPSPGIAAWGAFERTAGGELCSRSLSGSRGRSHLKVFPGPWWRRSWRQWLCYGAGEWQDPSRMAGMTR